MAAYATYASLVQNNEHDPINWITPTSEAWLAIFYPVDKQKVTWRSFLAQNLLEV